MKRVSWVAAVLFVCTVSGCMSELQQGYGKIQVGMSAKQVTALVGKPHRADSSNTHWVYFEDKRIAFGLEMTSFWTTEPQKVVNIGKWDAGSSGK